MFRARKQQFKLDLAQMHALCEANYVRLLRLFPDYETANQREFHLGPALVRLEVLERCRYTTMFRLHQQQGRDQWLGSLRVDVRAYHDAAMLEVGSFRSRHRLEARYAYPNARMYQEDEKFQQNQFLADWLEHCLLNGHSAAPIKAGLR